MSSGRGSPHGLPEVQILQVTQVCDVIGNHFDGVVMAVQRLQTRKHADLSRDLVKPIH